LRPVRMNCSDRAAIIHTIVVRTEHREDRYYYLDKGAVLWGLSATAQRRS
jgi:hypothetical protein